MEVTFWCFGGDAMTVSEGADWIDFGVGGKNVVSLLVNVAVAHDNLLSWNIEYSNDLSSNRSFPMYKFDIPFIALKFSLLVNCYADGRW